ncbi:MAG: hypothetical protein BWZ04_03281 [Firmicutes bacterium ADurb.BinA205]|nr:MAG: hypothetical protein BWZ04_03281 [Firmicutes bacterium ADurb.BinA205]
MIMEQLSDAYGKIDRQDGHEQIAGDSPENVQREPRGIAGSYCLKPLFEGGDHIAHIDAVPGVKRNGKQYASADYGKGADNEQRR